MKQIFKIEDKEMIHAVLDSTEYGTLALSVDHKPYAVPVNFVRVEEVIYFHGALSNKKMKILAENPHVSFSVVQSYALIDSHFSSTEGLACPATQFFKSVSLEGVAKLVKSREEKALMFEAMMAKLQPSGGYKPFSDVAYDTALKATAVVKIVPTEISCKFKFGQHLDDVRFEMIMTHLEKRGNILDHETIEMMKSQRNTK